jgi:L-amino acid N-acyltransferase YncA
MSTMHTIRPAEHKHLPGITAIYAYAVEELLVSWEYEAPDLDEMTRRYERRMDAGFPFLVAENAEGDVMGYAHVDAYNKRPGFRFTVEDSIYVAQHCRRMGLGRDLLTAIIGEATSLGYRQMIAAISLPDGEASLALHQWLGFQKVGEFPNIGWKHGQWLTAVYLQRKLGLGAQEPPSV